MDIPGQYMVMILPELSGRSSASLERKAEQTKDTNKRQSDY